MYIVKVLVEHPVHSLDTTFDYLYSTPLLKGVRVRISFNNKSIIGYVENVEYTSYSKEELENKAGFKYRYIDEVIDEEPLLNDELSELAYKLAKMTLSPRISALCAMLPTQLKPSSSTAVGIKMVKTVEFIENGFPQTKKQQECLEFVKNHNLSPLSDIPYSKSVIDALVKQGYVCYKML